MIHGVDSNLVLTVNYVVQDGKSNWLEGLILMCMST
jgi:Ca2+/H+ antiporter